MPVPRFDAEKQIPFKAVMLPREDRGLTRRGIFHGAVHTPNGDCRFSVQRELVNKNGATGVRWSREILMSYPSLVGNFDLRQYGWVPTEIRAKALGNVAVGTLADLVDRLAKLEARVKELEDKPAPTPPPFAMPS